jgi:hypothetical protein
LRSTQTQGRSFLLYRHDDVIEMFCLQKAADEEQRQKEAAKRVPRQQQHKKRGARDQRLVIKLDESAEHCMPDVMSHRFLYENLIQEAKERRVREGFVPDTSDPDLVKMNRTAQMRASHLQNQKVKAKAKAKDKDSTRHMRQFGDGATSQLDTFRRS